MTYPDYLRARQMREAMRDEIMPGLTVRDLPRAISKSGEKRLRMERQRTDTGATETLCADLTQPTIRKLVDRLLDGTPWTYLDRQQYDRQIDSLTDMIGARMREITRLQKELAIRLEITEAQADRILALEAAMDARVRIAAEEIEE